MQQLSLKHRKTRLMSLELPLNGVDMDERSVGSSAQMTTPKQIKKKKTPHAPMPEDDDKAACRAPPSPP